MESDNHPATRRILAKSSGANSDPLVRLLGGLADRAARLRDEAAASLVAAGMSAPDAVRRTNAILKRARASLMQSAPPVRSTQAQPPGSFPKCAAHKQTASSASKARGPVPDNRATPANSASAGPPPDVRQLFGPCRQREGIDVFKFLRKEPAWKRKLDQGIRLPVLISDLRRKDPGAAEELKLQLDRLGAFANHHRAHRESVVFLQALASVASAPMTHSHLTAFGRFLGYVQQELGRQDGPAALRQESGKPHSRAARAPAA